VPHRPTIKGFEGKFFRTGSRVELADLHPTDEYPLVPLLIEYAGNDRTGRGHRRSNDIHVLWRFDAARSDWDEIARVLSQGPEWVSHLAPIARREMETGQPVIAFVEVAGAVTARVLAVLDSELGNLEAEAAMRVMSFLYDQFTARLMAEPGSASGMF